MRKLNLIPVFWGLADVLRLIVYLATEGRAGRFPVVDTFSQANEIALSFGSLMPLVITSLGLLFYVSLAFSATLLLRFRTSGAVLSFVQAPFRVIFVVPSIVYLPSIATRLVSPAAKVFSLPASAVIVVVLVIALEGLRVWSLFYWRRQSCAA